VHIQFHEALGINQFADNIFADFMGILNATWSDNENGWLNTAGELLQGSFKDLLSVNCLEVGGALQVWEQLGRVLLVQSDLLGEDG
jgi:hypothetical protein